MAVLCEYDALPDIGHACGHNLIAEIGLAAAIGIKAAMEKAGNKLWKVCSIFFKKFLFSQSKERIRLTLKDLKLIENIS